MEFQYWLKTLDIILGKLMNESLQNMKEIKIISDEGLTSMYKQGYTAGDVAVMIEESYTEFVWSALNTKDE